jgi:hypothetical protein
MVCVKTCCCGCSLELGTKILAIVGLVLAVISIIISVAGIIPWPDHNHFVAASGIISIYQGIMALIASGLVLYGVM